MVPWDSLETLDIPACLELCETISHQTPRTSVVDCVRCTTEHRCSITFKEVGGVILLVMASGGHPVKLYKRLNAVHAQHGNHTAAWVYVCMGVK